MKQRIYDAHIHLSDPEYKSDIDMILNYMDLLKIKACCVSMDIETSNETMALYEKSKNVLPFIGIHPEMAQKESKPVYELIEKNNEIISGIGEIGLIEHISILMMNGKYKKMFFKTIVISREIQQTCINSFKKDII